MLQLILILGDQSTSVLQSKPICFDLYGEHIFIDLILPQTPQEQQIIEDLRKLKMRRRVRRSAESEMGKEKRNLKEAQVANFKITEKKFIVRLNSSPMLSARRS